MRSSFVATALVSAILARAETHLVKVGDGGLVFNPPQINAVEGDTVAFQFQAKNHSVTQSSFANPCTPLSGGVDSNFVNVQAGSTSLPQWSITLNNVSAPLWFFCKQAPPAPALTHCQSGMVFAINPTQQKTFDQFQAAAKALAPAGSNSTVSSGSASSTNPTSTADGTIPSTGTTGGDASGSTTSASGSSTSSPAGSNTGGSSTDSSGSTGSTTADDNSTTGKPSSAMKLGGSATGFITAVALVAFVL